MELKLPKLSATMDEGTIVEWVKQEGDNVQEGEILYLLETDKATLEVESTANGILEKIYVQPHIAVPVESLVCMIRTQEEQKESNSTEAKKGAHPDNTGDERLKVSPAGRKMAQELGVDLSKVIGTGPNGRIGIKDIEDAVKLIPPPPPSSSKTSPTAVTAEQLLQRKQASTMRTAIAKSMTASWTTIPTFWVEKWVCTENLLKAKQVLNQSRNEVFRKLTITDFLLQAVAFALSEMPKLNVRWTDNGEIEAISGCNIGLAISLDEGLVAPVLPNMNCPLPEIAEARSNLVDAVRLNKPYGNEFRAAITISNLGTIGVDRFRAIIKPDESMILAVGKMDDKVLAEDGVVVIRKGFSLVLSADHRVIDGSEAARFLARIGELIESGNWKLV